MASLDNLTPWQPGQSGNPAGKKPGTKHISTWIQEFLNDESFEARILDSKIGIKEYKGAPLKAIIEVAVVKAINGDTRWAEWLAKHGYGERIEQRIDADVSVSLRNKSDTELDEIIDGYTKGLSS